MSEAEARARLANQSSQEEKVAAADVVIDGSAPLEETRAPGRPPPMRGAGGSSPASVAGAAGAGV